MWQEVWHKLGSFNPATIFAEKFEYVSFFPKLHQGKKAPELQALLNLILSFTSFSSPFTSSLSSRKPDEPNPMPPTLSTWIDVPKNFPKAAATWLDENNHIKTQMETRIEWSSKYSYPHTNLPRKLSATERDLNGPSTVERASRSWLTPSQDSSQFSNFKSPTWELVLDTSTK